MTRTEEFDMIEKIKDMLDGRGLIINCKLQNTKYSSSTNKDIIANCHIDIDETKDQMIFLGKDYDG